MSLPRFYCPELSGIPGQRCALPKAAAHHAVRVLRLRPGEGLVVFNGAGDAWEARLESETEITLQAVASGPAAPPFAITLLQALPSGDKMDWVVQKAVELGVHRIQPVAASRCVVKLSGDRAEKRVQHWQDVAIGACEQSGRNDVPVIAPILTLDKALAALAEDGHARSYVLSPEASSPRLRDLPAPSVGESVALMIGPEGGWADEELLAAQRAGVAALRLGPRVLRTETAGLAAIAAIMALWGDL